MAHKQSGKYNMVKKLLLERKFGCPLSFLNSFSLTQGTTQTNKMPFWLLFTTNEKKLSFFIFVVEIRCNLCYYNGIDGDL